MRTAFRMAGVSGLSWVPVAVLTNRQTSLAILCGMIGPLIACCVTWVMAVRIYRQHPEASTAVMIAAFAGKLIYFPAYVAVMLKLLWLRPLPFIASFTAYFIVLYFVTAVELRRLFWGGTRS